MIKNNSIYNEYLLIIFRLNEEQIAGILIFPFNRGFFNIIVIEIKCVELLI